MKIKWNEKYTSIAVYVSLVVLFAVVCVFLFLNIGDFRVYFEKISSVLRPVFLGLVFAYLLNPIMKFFEKKCFYRLEKKNNGFTLIRFLSVTCTMLCLAAVITFFVFMMIPQVKSGYTDISTNAQVYIDRLMAWLEEKASGTGYLSGAFTKITEYLKNLLSTTYEIIQKILPSVSSAFQSVFTGLYNAGIGLAIAIYFLAAKERLAAQVKKIARAVFKESTYGKIHRTVNIADKSFGGYIRSVLASSIFVGTLCFFGMLIFNLPYYPLISLIVCVTNVIPIFGPVIGAIPGAFIIFIIDPIKSIWFILLILAIQQIDGNIFVPKIMGQNLGLDSTWVIIAITVMSGFFGITGMLIGVPLFSVIYSLLKEQINKKLGSRDSTVSLGDYCSSEMGRALIAETELSDKKAEASMERGRERRRIRAEKLKAKIEAVKAQAAEKKKLKKERKSGKK